MCGTEDNVKAAVSLRPAAFLLRNRQPSQEAIRRENNMAARTADAAVSIKAIIWMLPKSPGLSMLHAVLSNR